MAVGALAGVRPGLAYERIDDLRIVVSEACTAAIEVLGREGSLRLRCIDGPKTLEVRIEAPAAAFESAFAAGSPDGPEPEPDSFRIAWIERRYENGQLAATERWSAIVSIVVEPPRDIDRLRKNPLGIYVTSASWAKVL